MATTSITIYIQFLYTWHELRKKTESTIKGKATDAYDDREKNRFVVNAEVGREKEMYKIFGLENNDP